MSERCSQAQLFEASDRYRISLRLIAILTVALCLSLNVRAQTSLGTSSVGGIVLDPTSLGIQGVAVQLIDTQRGTTRNTITSGQGEYLFTAVLPGIYTVIAQQKGCVLHVKQEIEDGDSVVACGYTHPGR